MRTVEYFNGIKWINAVPFDWLKNASVDLANSIATGPQNSFFDKLDVVNGCLPSEYRLSVSPSWNWKPGTIPKTKEYIRKYLLQIDKKSNGLTGLFVRTKDRAWYLNRWINLLSELEHMKSVLKMDRYKPDVDIDKFREDMCNMVEAINSQIKISEDTTEGKVSYELFISDLDEPRHSKVHVNITLKGLSMSVQDNNKIVENIPLKDIKIIASANLRKLISNMSEKNPRYNIFNYTGIYESELLPRNHQYTGRRSRNGYAKMEEFPYIARNYINDDGELQYSSVCLDNYVDEINKSLCKLNLLNTSLSLISWAQYYNTSFSHPYNTINMLHVGMPDYMSSEYAALAGYRGSCSDIMKVKHSLDNKHYYTFDNITNFTNECDEIKCQFRDNHCRSYGNHVEMSFNMQDGDNLCMIESFIGYMVYDTEYIKRNYTK